MNGPNSPGLGGVEGINGGRQYPNQTELGGRGQYQNPPKLSQGIAEMVVPVDTLTNVLTQTMEQLKEIDERLDILYHRIEGQPDLNIALATDKAPHHNNLVELASNIRNTVKTIWEKVAELDQKL